MKKFVFAIAAVLIITLNSQAQNNQEASGDSIIFEKTTHDYGTIVQSSNGETEFVFVNKGNKPLVLNNVRASCGCTTPDWTRTPVLPGAKGSIKVKYNTELLGSFSKTITVTSNAVNSNLTLLIKGNVIQKETAQP